MEKSGLQEAIELAKKAEGCENSRQAVTHFISATSGLLSYMQNSDCGKQECEKILRCGVSFLTKSIGLIGKESTSKADVESKYLVEINDNNSINTGLPFTLPIEKIIGMVNAKKVLEEQLIWPIQFPDLFREHKSWQSVLLYGPTGVAKSTLAASIIQRCKINYICLSPSTTVDKYYGGTEKLLRKHFEMALANQPVCILIDEMDSFMKKREGTTSEGDLRMKAELLNLFNNIKGTRVFVIGISNIPEICDTAFLKRFDKKVYCGLPNKTERRLLLQSQIGNQQHNISHREFEKIAEQTAGYTGHDLFLISKSARNIGFRQLLTTKTDGELEKYEIVLRKDHIDKAMEDIRPTVKPSHIVKYTRLQKQFGGM